MPSTLAPLTPSVFEAEIKELLAASPADEAKSFHQAGQIFDEDKVELGNPAAIDSEVPGVDLTKLTADQKEAFKKKLEGKKCTCGCNLTMLNCRQDDRGCSTSLKLAQRATGRVSKGKGRGRNQQVAETGGRELGTMRILLWGGVLALMAASLGWAQGNNPVVEAHAVLATSAAHANSPLKLAVLAQVAAGYHINDHKPSLDYLIPTELEVDPSDQFTVKSVVYPKGTPKKFAFSDIPALGV